MKKFIIMLSLVASLSPILSKRTQAADIITAPIQLIGKCGLAGGYYTYAFCFTLTAIDPRTDIGIMTRILLLPFALLNEDGKVEINTDELQFNGFSDVEISNYLQDLSLIEARSIEENILSAEEGSKLLDSIKTELSDTTIEVLGL